MKEMIGNDTRKPMKIMFIVMVFISSFILPFVFIIIFQDILFFSESQWFFNAPFLSYVLLIGGMMLLAILLSVDEFIKSKRNDRDLKTGPWMVFLSVALSSLCFVLGIFHYYYFDDEGLHFNQVTSLQELDVQWNEIDEVIQVTTRENNMEVYKEHIFITKDGLQLIIPHNYDFMMNRKKIITLAENNGARISEQFVEPSS
ncbi:hypothetical protein GLW08_12840 [Pontibacillus yanchengensis]|uniref:Uncharacterized protein n=2 Tax=Pontibacillus yanchengensis TaxID=462910 RepID=A0ACC7VHH3_9BACI|nr:hypothetical protein [Pontibacillus yanchengensis]MYL34414.1 hypothetical protein [Pontibacillus yanchengensis]MYL54222.1 hypothetical protein [Pontibacillus yanchengensis]